MKYSDLYIGQVVQLDDGFTCRAAGPAVVNFDIGHNEFYFECSEGRHYLMSQCDWDDNETLVGVDECNI